MFGKEFLRLYVSYNANQIFVSSSYMALKSGMDLEFYEMLYWYL